MEFHAFISYSHEDRAYAAELERLLCERGLSCWRDQRIAWGAEFPADIERALSDSQAMVLVVSEESASRDWVLREVTLALSKNVPILPIMKMQGKLPWPLSALLASVNYRVVLPGELADRCGELVDELKAAGVGALSDPVDKRLDEGRLTAALPGLAGDDIARLRVLAGHTYEQFHGTPGHGLWTVHGLRHTNALISNLGQVLPERIREHRHYCFCLAAAACLHDVGIVQRVPDTSRQDVRAAVRPARSGHHVASRSAVHDLVGKAQLDTEAGLIGDLCYYHNWETNAQEKAREPELAELLSLFRIANACDLGPLRAPPQFWTFNRRQMMYEPGQQPCVAGQGSCEASAVSAFWLRNLVVKNVEFDHQDRRVSISSWVPCDALEFVPRAINAGLRRSLKQLTPFVGAWDVDTPSGSVGGEGCALTVEEVVRFGADVCSDELATVASSGDISDYFMNAAVALAEARAPRGLRPNAEHSEAAAQAIAVLEELADSLPRTRAELHALHSLASRYRDSVAKAKTPFSKLRKARAEMQAARSDHQFCPAAPGASSFSALARNGFTALKNVVGNKPAYRFFMFGYSGPVSVFIQYCAHAGKQIEIVTPTMRPIGEGPSVQVVERLQSLAWAKDRIKVNVIPDAAIPSALAGGACGGKTDLVLMGCEALLVPEGQSIADGGTRVANSLGCLAVAQLANANGVPTWVFTETTKGYWDREISCWDDDGEGRASTIPVSAFMQEAAASEAVRESPASYPRSEVVPSDLIAAIITEKSGPDHFIRRPRPGREQ